MKTEELAKVNMGGDEVPTLDMERIEKEIQERWEKIPEPSLWHKLVGRIQDLLHLRKVL